MKTLIRLPNWIGDAVMAAPAVRALLAADETSSLSVWGPPKVAVLFQGFPNLERIFEIDSKAEPHRLEEIRAERYDRIYLLPNSYSSAREAKELGVPERIGYRTQWRGGLLTRPVRLTRRIRNLRMAEYYLHLLPEEARAHSGDPIPRLYVSDVERETVLGKLGEVGAGPHPPIGLAPGAAFGPAKQWFIENFAELARRLTAEAFKVVVLGGPDDREAGSRIVADIPREKAMNLAGETTLREMMAAVSVCGALVTNDSGPLHLADALGTPTAALFGSTDSTWTGPRGPNHEILQSTVPCNPCFLRECPIGRLCFREIEVEAVYRAVMRILDATAAVTDRTSLHDPAGGGVR